MEAFCKMLPHHLNSIKCVKEHISGYKRFLNAGIVLLGNFLYYLVLGYFKYWYTAQVLTLSIGCSYTEISQWVILDA